MAREPFGEEAGGGKFLVAVAAAEEVGDAADVLWEGVEFVGDGEFEAFLYFSFEFVDFLFVVAIELARAFRCLAVHAATTVEE